MSDGSSEPVTPEAWAQPLAAELTAFLEETRAVMNAAREGHWIADTEEVVRDAGERLRQRALEKLRWPGAAVIGLWCEQHPFARGPH